MSPAGWPLDGPAEIVHNGCPSNLSTTTPLPRLACLPRRERLSASVPTIKRRVLDMVDNQRVCRF